MHQINKIKTRLLLSNIHPHNPVTGNYPLDKKPIPSAVVILLYPSPSGLQVLMIKRAAHLRHHGAQIAFVGGKRDPEDSSLWHTAIREAEEEIGINANSIEFIGSLSHQITQSGFHISPFVGYLPKQPKLHINHNEVQSVINLPLKQLLDPQFFSYSHHKKGNQWRRFTWISLEMCVIWGATAKIIDDMRRWLTP